MLTHNSILDKKQNRIIYSIGASILLIVCIAVCLNRYELALIPSALGVLFLCFYKPEFYALILCFLVPLSVFVEDIGGGFGVSLPTEPMIWLLFLYYIFYLLMNGKINIQFIKTPLVLAIFLNFGWMFITVIASSMPFVSLKYFLARSWFMVIFFLFLFKIFKNPLFIIRYLTYMIYGSCIVVCYTLVKHYGEDFSRGWGYMIMKPFFSDHTIYAAYIAFFIPVSIMFVLRGNFFNLSVFHRIVFAFISLILILGIIFSYTRAAWVSLIAAILFYGLIKLKIKFQTILITILVVASGFFIYQDKILYNLEANKKGSADDLEAHAQSVSNITTDPSNLERMNRWNCAFSMFKERPIFGFGPGTYTFQYAPFQNSKDLTLISTNSGDLGNTHSEYFNALSEMGIFGLISWLAVFLSSLALGLKIVYQIKRPAWQRSLTTALLLGLITYYVHAFLNNYSDFDKIAAPLWGFMAIMVAISFYWPYNKENVEKLTNLIE